MMNIKLDSADTVFFNRELETIKTKSYDVLYAQRGARLAFPISYEAGEGADSITYRQYDRKGMAKIISNYADDLPFAEVTGKEFTVRVKDLGMAYQYSNREVRNARMIGKPLETRRATATIEGIEDKINALAWNGDADFNIQGYFDNANVPVGSAPTGTWSTATSQEIYDDVVEIVNGVTSQSSDVHNATELWLPIAQYGIIKTKRMDSGTDTTIAKYIEDNLGVVIRKFKELSGAGAGATDRMVAVERSEMNFTLEIPMEVMTLPFEQRNLTNVVNNIASCGGVIVYRPLSMKWSDGI